LASFPLLLVLPLLTGNARPMPLQAIGLGVQILHPVQRNIAVKAPAASITVRVLDAAIDSVEILEPFDLQKHIEASTSGQKASFAREFRSLVPSGAILRAIQIKTYRVRGSEQTTAYAFRVEENVDLKRFWSSTTFKEILAQVYDTKTAGSEVRLSGWIKRKSARSTAAQEQQVGKTFSSAFSLMAGTNSFYVSTLSHDGNRVIVDSVSFLYAIESGTEGTKDKYAREVFHGGPSETQCLPCHSFSIPTDVERERSTVEVECKTCHEALISQKSSHAPASAWDCLSCHDPTSSPKFKIYGEKTTDEGMCIECHADKKEGLGAKPSVHPVVESCTTCHDPHGSVNLALVVSPVNVLCGSCHEEISQTPHPVVRHPLKGRTIASRGGAEISCVSCHDPHFSDNERLLVSPKSMLCQQCHEK